MWLKYMPESIMFTYLCVGIISKFKLDFAKKINRKTFFAEPSSSQWWGWHGGRNFRAMVFAMIRVHITGPPTNALAAILCTTGKMKASTGDRSIKGVSDIYSPLTNIFMLESAPSIAKFQKVQHHILKLRHFLQKRITVVPC